MRGSGPTTITAKRRWGRLIWIGALLLVLGAAHVGASLWRYQLDDVLANRENLGIPDGSDGPAHVTPLRDSIYQIGVSGINVVAVIGDEGVLLVDSAEPPELERIEAALATLTDLPVRYIINTHPHGDHVAGNSYFARDSADIIATTAAEASLRQDYSAAGNAAPPPRGVLPNILFDGSHSLRFDGHTIEITEVPDSHSVGDAVVRFVEANVIAAGDLFINEGLPYIATDRDRTIDGYLAGMEKVVAMADSDTVVAAGHGPAGDRARLDETHSRLKRVRDAVVFRKSLGLSPKLMLLTYPDHDWPAGWDRYGVARKWFVKAVYRSLP